MAEQEAAEEDWDLGQPEGDEGVDEFEEEPEADEPAGTTQAPDGDAQVFLTNADATLDAIVSGDGSVVSALSAGLFGSLVSGVRACAGARVGRLYFEVAVLEEVPGDEATLSLGFSLPGTPLPLPPSDSCGGLCRAPAPQAAAGTVCGVLLNLSQDSKCANTVSFFVDGSRATKPIPLPADLRGKALYPTVCFRGLVLAVNWGPGGRLLRPPPFRCLTFAQAPSASLELGRGAAGKGRAASKEGCEVLVPVGLPDGNFFSFADFLADRHPHLVELSDRRVRQWCLRSGLVPALGASRDQPGVPSEDWRLPLLTRAQLTGRGVLPVGLRHSLRREGREELLSQLPAAAKKVAVVALGEPSKEFLEWKAAKGGAGVEDNGLPDLSEQEIAASLDGFSLPTLDEGFDEVRFEWLDCDDAEEHLRSWVLKCKASLVVAGLQPGEWFVSQKQAWHQARVRLREGHMKFQKALKSDAIGLARDAANGGAGDIDNVDGQGTPMYGYFEYEDWVILAWRYELHLLAHAFVEDVADPDRQGIPERHVPHYFKLYFGKQWEPEAGLGLKEPTVAAVLKLLQASVELVEPRPGVRILRSTVEKDVPLDDFVRAVEKYRRDRARRREAGDESAKLCFPKRKAAPAAGAGAAKRPRLEERAAAAQQPPKAPAKAIAKRRPPP